ncbi:LysR substrate-binding domain-containing protein [Ruegeria sp.]|uniref:LysR substrate-binding domain-containing protein n=1 Tax=Ruegeria sp. TaxID=1879320 RepID=UPI003B592C1B
MRRFVPSLSALTAFEAAAQHLNFTRAAGDLNLTQSGISRQVKHLEDLLGTRLFDRFGPRLVLTDAGTAYAKEVKRILDDLEKCSIDIVRGWKEEEAIQIGALPSVASRWLAPKIKRFATQFPTSLLEITTVNEDVNFEETHLDIAVLRGRGGWTAAHAVELFQELFVVVAAPSLIPVGSELRPEQFRDFPQLQNAQRPDNWMKWIKATGQQMPGSLQGLRFGNTSILINAAISGSGIAVVPSFLVQQEINDGVLHTPFGPKIKSGESYYAVYPQRKANWSALLVLRDWLASESVALKTEARNLNS